VVKIIEREEARLKLRSSLRVFARMDVGLMAGEEGRPHYFVNEVTRAPHCGLWLSHDHERTVKSVSRALGIGLRRECDEVSAFLCPTEYTGN